MNAGFTSMLASLKTLSPDSSKFDIYVIGGFIDSRKISQDVTAQLFDIFIKTNDKFVLKLCLVTKLNDTIKENIHYPNAYGLAYNIKTSSVFMCNCFKEKGPDLIARSARHFSPNGNMNIFDIFKSQLTIGPFDYEKIKKAELLLKLPNHVLLKYFSTSPDQEPPEFVNNLKNTFRIMIEHPDPYETYFKDMQPFIYDKHDDGSWKLVHE